MRRWLILVMVLMLPLRGWAGDFMSVQMATAAATAGEHAGASMPADCPMHAAAVDSTDDAAPAHGGGMSACSSCELCIPVAKLAGGALEAVSLAVHEHPLARPSAFASAALAAAVEPPIS